MSKTERASGAPKRLFPPIGQEQRKNHLEIDLDARYERAYAELGL